MHIATRHTPAPSAIKVSAMLNRIASRGERAEVADLEQPGHPSIDGKPVRHAELKLAATIAYAIFQPVQVSSPLEKPRTGDDHTHVSRNTHRRGLRHDQHDEGD